MTPRERHGARRRLGLSPLDVCHLLGISPASGWRRLRRAEQEPPPPGLRPVKGLDEMLGRAMREPAYARELLTRAAALRPGTTADTAPPRAVASRADTLPLRRRVPAEMAVRRLARRAKQEEGS